MKTSVYLRPPKKLLEHFPKLGDLVPIETILDIPGTTSRRAVLHIQKAYARAPGPHHIIDSEGEAPFAFTGSARLAF